MEDEIKEEIDTKYFTVLQISKDNSLKGVIENINKRLPKKVSWSKITIHIIDETGFPDETIIYEHSDKKVLKDKRSKIINDIGNKKVERAVSNISFNEYYFDIFMEKE